MLILLMCAVSSIIDLKSLGILFKGKIATRDILKNINQPNSLFKSKIKSGTREMSKKNPMT